MRGLTRFLSGILTLTFVILLCAAGGLAWFNLQVDGPGPAEQQLTVLIRPGDPTRVIAERLENQGAISSQTVFLAQFMSQNALARLANKSQTQLKAGEYVIPARASIRDIMTKLSEGRALLHGVTVPEGLTSYAVVQRLRADTNLSGDIENIPEEGSLLPETFRVPRNMPRKDVIGLLAAEQEKFLAAEWAARQPDLPLKSPREALILASIVEKESGPRDDPARIASVFINRLRRGIRLQSDPTILYGKHGEKVAWGSTIYRSDIARKTDYNTYQIDGLPPGPICNPGRRSIRAVLNPATTNDLYFVADGRGGHVFSQTLRQHQAAVAQWRKIEREIRANEAAKEGSRAANGQQEPDDAKIAKATILNASGGPVSVASGGDDAEGPVPLPVRRPARR